MQIKSIVAGAAIALIAGVGSVSADELSVAGTTSNQSIEPEQAQFGQLKHAGEPIALSVTAGSSVRLERIGGVIIYYVTDPIVPSGGEKITAVVNHLKSK